MPVGGVVTTSDVTAFETDPEMEPFVPTAQAVLAAIRCRWQSCELDVVAVIAEVHC
jgi:hypothetical protein